MVAGNGYIIIDYISQLKVFLQLLSLYSSLLLASMGSSAALSFTEFVVGSLCFTCSLACAFASFYCVFILRTLFFL